MPPAKRTTSTTAAETKDEAVKDQSEAPKTEASKTETKTESKTETKADTTQPKVESGDENEPKGSPLAPGEDGEPSRATRGLSSLNDPAVNETDASAANAAKTPLSKLKSAARVQVRQFDTSGFGTNVLDSLSDAEDRKKDSGKK